MTDTRASSEIACEKSFLLLISATTTPMMSAMGLVMPAWNRGFCFRIAASKVLPDRGRPEMKWNVLDGFAESGVADMRALPLVTVVCPAPSIAGRGARRRLRPRSRRSADAHFVIEFDHACLPAAEHETQQFLGGAPCHFVHRLVDGRQRRPYLRRDGGVVETAHGNVAGYRQACFRCSPDRAGGHVVVAREDGGRPLFQRQQLARGGDARFERKPAGHHVGRIFLQARALHT